MPRVPPRRAVACGSVREPFPWFAASITPLARAAPARRGDRGRLALRQVLLKRAVVTRDQPCRPRSPWSGRRGKRRPLRIPEAPPARRADHAEAEEQPCCRLGNGVPGE